MIKANIPYSYVDRASVLTGTLQVEISDWKVYKDHIVYTIEDFIINDEGAKRLINTRQKRLEIEEINQLDQSIPSSGVSTLPKFERDWKKTQLALLHFVKTDLIDDGIHTIYNLLPSHWVLTD